MVAVEIILIVVTGTCAHATYQIVPDEAKHATRTAIKKAIRTCWAKTVHAYNWTIWNISTPFRR